MGVIDLDPFLEQLFPEGTNKMQINQLLTVGPEKRRQEFKAWIGQPFVDYLNTFEETITIESTSPKLDGVPVAALAISVPVSGPSNESINDSVLYFVDDSKIFYSEIVNQPDMIVANSYCYNIYVDTDGTIIDIHVVDQKQTRITPLKVEKGILKADKE